MFKIITPKQSTDFNLNNWIFYLFYVILVINYANTPRLRHTAAGVNIRGLVVLINYNAYYIYIKHMI